MTRSLDRAATVAASAGNGHGPASGNGSRGEDRPRRGPEAGARRLPGPSARPAAIVFGIILVIFVAGFVADDLTSAHHSAPAPHHLTTTPVAGTGGLVPEPSSDVLGSILTPGQPPSNIVSALVVPKGTEVVPGTSQQLGLGSYDAAVEVVFPAPEADAITFVRKELAAGSWAKVSAGASGSGYRVVGEHPGSDGYEWELGVTLAPTTFSSPVAGMSVPETGVTEVTLRLFAISDGV